MKYIKWGFWTLIYLFRPIPQELGSYLQKGERTRAPWWRFKPCIYHNDDGKQWEIWLEHEQGYVEKKTIPVEVCIGMDSGRIVGITIFDETLKSNKKLN